MEIVILGDVGASSANLQAFCKAEEDLFSKEIRTICNSADAVLLNLEKPLADVETPLGKCPPDYSAPTETINGIKMLCPTVATLANNHIMDQKAQGMQSTIDVLKNNGILHVGAGNNIHEARKPVIIEIKGCKIGIYACCEKEFSYATESCPGANVFDPLETFDDIEQLRKTCDYLIVLHHGGMQGYPYPTPYQQRVCRKMCEKGADLVICQHSHIISCEEKFADGTIVYGQGNFLLDDLNDENWHSGLIIKVTKEGSQLSIEYIPTRTENHKVILHPNSDAVIADFSKRSTRIQNQMIVQEMFSKLCNENLSDYLVKLSGKGQLTQRIMRRIGITKNYKNHYSDEACNRILDYLYCDSHREAIEYGLEAYIENKK